MSGVTTSSLSLAGSLRNWVILDYEEANGLTIRPWAPFLLSFKRCSALVLWSWPLSGFQEMFDPGQVKDKKGCRDQSSSALNSLTYRSVSCPLPLRERERVPVTDKHSRWNGKLLVLAVILSLLWTAIGTRVFILIMKALPYSLAGFNFNLQHNHDHDLNRLRSCAVG